MKNVKLTVNLITYNHKQFISKCLDSLLSQKTNFEYIIRIFDDCSTDGTTEICREYANKFPNIIQFFPNEKNMGATLNSLRSYENIETPYYMFIEGDDYCCDNEKFQIQVDALDNNPDCSFCSHYANMYYNDKQKVFGDPFPHIIAGIYTIEDVKNTELYFQSHICSRVIRTSAINIDKKHPEYFLFDLTQVYELFNKGNMFFIDRIMTNYVITNSGIWSVLSAVNKYKFVSDSILAYNEYTNHIFEKNLLINLQVQLNCAYYLNYKLNNDIDVVPKEVKPITTNNKKILLKNKIKALKHYILPPIILDIGNIPRDLGRKLKNMK